MKYAYKLRQWALLIGGSGILLQASCSTADFVVFLQTVFLGITAAGAVAILRNV